TLVVIDLSQPMENADRELIDRARRSGRFMIVANKSDLRRVNDAADLWTTVSALTGEGIEALRVGILNSVVPEGVVEQESGFITSLRHEQLLRESLQYLAKAREASMANIPHEMLLLDMYSALRPIDAITGATTADDILNRIFSTFCI